MGNKNIEGSKITKKDSLTKINGTSQVQEISGTPVKEISN